MKYNKDKEAGLVVCNCCNCVLEEPGKLIKKEYLTIKKTWGYFSKWDGCTHSFDLCADCYEKMIRDWQHQPTSTDATELL